MKSSFVLSSLVERGSLTAEACEFLGIIVALHKNTIISGGTGTGKTSLAQIIARQTRNKFERLSGVESNVSDMRRVLSAATNRLENTGQLDAAVEEYRKALIFAPDDADYRISFASALIGSGRFEEAQSHIDQLLQEDPTNGALNRMQAYLAERQKRFPAAIDYYQRAVYEYWPPHKLQERARARWELISLLEKAGRREEAIGELMTLYANTTIGPATYVGLPVIGFAVQSFTNGILITGGTATLSSYGGNFAQKGTRFIEFVAPSAPAP